MIELQPHSRGIVLPVRAHAGAKHSAILGVRQGMLRVAVTEAPEKGKANKAIIAMLSDALGVPKSSLELIAGATSPRKQFLVLGADIDRLRAVLAPLVDK